MRSRRGGRGGVGSNQYRNRPPTAAPSEDQTPRTGDGNLSPEEVAWVFHPGRGEWEHAGARSWTEAAPWIEGGFAAVVAGDWMDQIPGVTAAEADAWRTAGFRDPHQASRWNALGFTPVEAEAWTAAEFRRPEAAAALRDDGLSIETAGAAWDAAGFTLKQRVLSRTFSDPRECRRWVDWLDAHYHDGDAGKEAALSRARLQTVIAGDGYDFETVAAEVLDVVKPSW